MTPLVTVYQSKQCPKTIHNSIDSGHSTLPGEEPADELMMRFSPELDPDAADAIRVLESVVIEAETKEKETDEKFRDLTEVRGPEVVRSQKPVVKKI